MNKRSKQQPTPRDEELKARDRRQKKQKNSPSKLSVEQEEVSTWKPSDTELRDVEVVTLRLKDRHLHRPFQTFTVAKGNRGPITHLVTQAAADHHHTALVNAMAKQVRR